MLSEFRGWVDSPFSPSGEALASVRHALALAEQCPVLLGYTPVARVNPYQALLYQRFEEVGIHPAPIPKAAKLVDYAALAGAAEMVAVHVHWPSFVLEGATSPSEAHAQLSGFTQNIARLRGAGVRLVYTVHNEIPHDAAFLEEELTLQQYLLDAADVTHVMSEGSLEALAALHRLPRHVLVSPHPNYRGAYPDHVSRETARLTLGLDPEDVVYVVLGAQKGYKALDLLLPALTRLNEGQGPRRRLIVAGAPDQTPEVAAFVEQALLHPDVLIAPHHVPVEHVQYYLRAADIGLVAYRRTLNSGALLLYQSFDLPVIATVTPSLDHVAGEGIAERVDDLSVCGLMTAIRRADRLLGPSIQAEVHHATSRYDAGPLSVDFGRRLRERLAGGLGSDHVG